MTDSQEFSNVDNQQDTVTNKAQKLMVLVGNGNADQVIRFGHSIAQACIPNWIVAHVSEEPLSGLKEQGSLMQSLQLAGSLGADVVTLSGYNLVEEILSYAKEQNITHIVVGRSRRPWRWLTFRTSLSAALLRRARGISITIISGEGKGIGGIFYGNRWENCI